MLDPKEKYVSLVTYRKNGDPVATPVWFADLGGRYGVITETNVGKVKRIRHTSNVSVTACDVRGQHRPHAVTLQATATIVEGPDAVMVRRAIGRKYPIAYRLFSLLWFAQEMSERMRRRTPETEVAIVFTLD